MRKNDTSKLNGKTLPLYRTLADSVNKTIRDIESLARDGVAEILESLPDRQIASDDALGYLNYQTMGDDFIEGAIHALRIDGEGSIQMTCDVDYDDDDNPTVKDWDEDGRELTFNEFDHYMTVNWPLTLDMVVGYLEHHPEIMDGASETPAEA